MISFGGTPFISLGFNNVLNLDKSNISAIEVIDQSSEISVASAATRGFIGEMLFGPIGLAAAGTAERDERYILGIVFNNEERSVIDIDGSLYRQISASIEK